MIKPTVPVESKMYIREKNTFVNADDQTKGLLIGFQNAIFAFA
jgi:hypothetical protein